MRSIDAPYQTDIGLEGTMHLRQFDDMGELVDLGAAIDEQTEGMARYTRASLSKPASFAGTASMRETVDLGRRGWPEGTEKLAEIMDDLDVDVLQATSLQPEIYYDVVGEEPDVGAYLTGDPENMINWHHPPEQGNKMVEFIVNASVGGDVPTQKILKSGAGIVAAAQALEANGYSVGITAAFPTESGYLIGRDRRAMCHYVPLSVPGQYFDLDTVAFGLSHPSVFRRLIFGAMEQESEEIRRDYRNSDEYGYTDKLRFIPKSEYKGFMVRDWQGSEPLELGQLLIDVATGQKDVKKVDVGKF